MHSANHSRVDGGGAGRGDSEAPCVGHGNRVGVECGCTVPCYIPILETITIMVIFTAFNVSYLTLGEEEDDGAFLLLTVDSPPRLSGIDFDPWKTTPLRMLTSAIGCAILVASRYLRRLPNICIN